MDLFEKARQFTRPQEVKALGLYPYFLPLEDSEGTEVTIYGKKIIMIGSNNYLGLTTHPKVREAAIEAIKKYGTSCTGSRFLNGTLKLHMEAEEKLAAFVGKPAALIFSTGMQVNLGAISCLLGKDDIAIIDKDDHASIVDGVRLGFGEMRRFVHSDLASLERQLAAAPDKAGVLVVVDGVYSMGGDIAPLPAIVKLVKQYGARLYVDDAHSLGVLGPQGRGTAAHFNLTDQVDLIMGTFSKSFASLGGFVAGDADVMQWVQHSARSFIYSASIAPASLAAAIAALEIMQTESDRIEQLWHNTEKMRKGYQAMGFNTRPSETPVIPIMIGDDQKTFAAWKALFEAGIYTNAVVSPAVPSSKSLLRTSYMATHTDAQLDRVLDTFQRVGRELGLIN
ncbi:MAG TPA: aminotransferase class I/II-fold pyridoxal phosphate-dependent enzyme [Anaerolineae bacterium]|nr:aminotransferase class I/II-fold pyridoxal phosphate-dependent enzyme [Anaerolineae bacterium]